MDYLQNGITVKYVVKGEERSSVVKLIDYADADKNDFYVVNQYTFVENGNNRRPDIILFINGLPLVLMELKVLPRTKWVQKTHTIRFEIT